MIPDAVSCLFTDGSGQLGDVQFAVHFKQRQEKGGAIMRYNQDMLDAISLASFIMTIANYNENLTQSDKDDLMAGLDKQTNQILDSILVALDEQNMMLEAILDKLNKKD